VSALADKGTENTIHNVKVKEPFLNKKGAWEMPAQVIPRATSM
jgi:hypothetical protein